MPSNQFLDNLCELGYASKRDTLVKTSKPSYPYKAFQCEGSHFHATVTQYTIEFGIAKMDNTKVIIPKGQSLPQPEAESQISILEKILTFLENLGRQRGGIPLTSKFGGEGPEVHADHPDNPVNVDELLAAMGLFGPAPGESGLDLAWAIEYLRELIGEMKKNEAEYKAKEQEILSNFKDTHWEEKYLKNQDDYEKKLKELLERGVKDIENKRSGNNQGARSHQETNNAKSIYLDNLSNRTVVDSVFRLDISVHTITQPVIMGGYARGHNKSLFGNYHIGDTIEVRKITITRQNGVENRDTIRIPYEPRKR